MGAQRLTPKPPFSAASRLVQLFTLLLVLLLLPISVLGQATKMVWAGGNGNIFSIEPDGSSPELWKDLTGASGPGKQLVESNEKLWGVASHGGLYGAGVLYSINADGSNYTRVLDFNGTNGSLPQGALLEHDGKLWGMAGSGGFNGLGVIYNINNDGNNFTVVHHFNGTDGNSSSASLILSNGKLWGVTDGGGVSNIGTIFSINTDGTGFTKHHDFDDINGKYPRASLVESGGKLWGTTANGGVNTYYGVIFSIDNDGSNFTKVHDFDNTNGGVPFATLIESNGKLWGTTEVGGVNSKGIIFTLNTDGTGFTKIHDFDLASLPKAPLIESGGKLWGTSSGGGADELGSIFSINNDGSGFTIVVDCDDITGYRPQSGLLESNGRIWGATRYSGGGSGNIFSIDLDGNNYEIIHVFGNPNGQLVYDKIIYSNSKLWGMAKFGGAKDKGTIFNLNIDGGNFTKVHDFNGDNGEHPEGSLIESGNKLWGMTNDGGANSFGTIFNLDMDGSNFNKIHDFDNVNGSFPQGTLVIENGKFWGITLNGGVNGMGIIFSLELDGTEFTKHYDFDGVTGANPRGSLHPADEKLWGMTQWGGPSGNGNIFSIDNDGTNFVHRHDFDQTNGMRPVGQSLVVSNGKLWGTTAEGGSNALGVIFNINTDGTGFTNVHDFDGANGSIPYGTLVENDNKLWGTTNSGGANGVGIIYSIGTDGTEFTNVFDLTQELGANPYNGSFYLVKADQVVSFSQGNKIYGNDSFTLVATSNSSNPIEFTSSDPDVIYISGNLASIVATGMVTITAFQEEDEGYYAGYDEQTLSVLKKTLTATADTKEYIYGGTEPPLTISYNGFINNDSESDITPPTANTSHDGTVGTYEILLSGGSSTNYTFSLVNGTLTINRADLFITADDKTITEGDQIPTLTMNYVGFIVGDTEADITSPTITTDAISSSPPGEYDILLAGGSVDNYELILIDGKLVIEGVAPPLGVDNPGLVIAIFPNPASSWFSIEKDQLIENIRLFNLDGKVLRTFQNADANVYSIENLSAGMYLLSIETKSGHLFTKRLEVKN